MWLEIFFSKKTNYANNQILTLGFVFVIGEKFGHELCVKEFQPVNNNNIEWNYVVCTV